MTSCSKGTQLHEMARSLCLEVTNDDCEAVYHAGGHMERTIERALIAVRREAIEECAKVAVEYQMSSTTDCQRHAGRDIAALISARIEESK